MNSLSTQILNEAKECFKGARQNLIKGAALLYKIKSENLWKEEHESFSAYLEEECQISDGQASKLIASFSYFCVENGFSQAKLTGTDVEKLYFSLKLPGTAEKKLASAQTLSRSELKTSIRESVHGICTHEGESYETWRKYLCGEWVRQ